MNFDVCQSYKSFWQYDTGKNTYDADRDSLEGKTNNGGEININNLASLNWRFW